MTINHDANTWENYIKTVGLNIQKVRISRNMSQEQLAYSAGISRFSYQQLEKGESRPHSPANPALRSIMAISQILGVSLDVLLPADWPDLRA
ncbi:MAG: helix-turn-helix transcriptional regulator [Bifidobacterium crudilactis]|jgi:transcriptional regulator with XRE-family HTH domain|uniref:Helix-turn-helix transcriptional regulator n=1 Tax=Bifidobacterium crudilactis TaxID=327277 RepID=A0A971ICN6_9BIFI|nr:helix-turn-helix transcriptional regulator [Bifidobacterium crudilactis]NLT79744.1 helix-turn-helix transcriptional regulator [Bifidobacterium crudilactis]